MRERTAAEIVDETNCLARELLRLLGFAAPEGIRFYKSGHPRIQEAWALARAAQIYLTETDPEDALMEIER